MGIPGNEDVECKGNKAHDDWGHTVHYQIETSGMTGPRRLSEGMMVAKAKLVATKSSKHHGYSLRGTASSKISVPMTSLNSPPVRFNWLRSGHAPRGRYLKRFAQWKDDTCRWCSSRTQQIREHSLCQRWQLTKPAESTLETDGECYRMASRQMPRCMHFWTVVDGEIWPIGIWLPGHHWHRKFRPNQVEECEQ